MSAPLYKVMGADEWTTFERSGTYAGSEVDRRDGYVHLSAADQVAGTVARHFADRTGLVSLAVDCSATGKALKWETARDGACFPHLYAPLTLEMVMSAEPIPDDPDQRALAMALLAV